ncbi:proline dehydrogenase [Peribacillus asahii]|uniref:proline dehydrogenase n=1 Tax=Peribacillus asahii TaxID=228899 RepID=A0A398B982_9BACI|nr:proline dehydrogenase family protein [Peribacillus asahii]RID85388.1 proline dehydrogenase [Peribacillus asahii]
MEAIMRNFFQFLARNKRVNKWAAKYGLHLGAQKFVAGLSIEQAITQVRLLYEDGRAATLDHLGEFVRSEAEARQSAYMCLKALEAIAEANVPSHLSVKLTSLGLDISDDLCFEQMCHILNKASEHRIFVRIDMEDYAHCQQAIDLFKRLRKMYDGVGLVLQAYLYRTEQDLRDLGQISANLRLVKGAYKESPEVAFPKKADVDKNYLKIIKQHLLNGHYTAVASHDEQIIHQVKEFVREKEIKRDQFEFQMLFGIREDMQKKLASEGYTVRVYVPYGKDWFGYYMRRLAERPANVWFVMKNWMK